MDRRERERREADDRRPRVRWDWGAGDGPPAKPSEYGIEQVNPDDPPAVGLVFSRVSGGRQDYSPHLRWEKKQFEELGVEVIGVVGEVARGRFLDPEERKGLFKALDKAAGKTLIAPCTSRLLRAPDFHPYRNSNAGPDADQLEEFARLAAERGVRVMTFNDPDASPEEDRAFLEKIADEVSKAGRPRKKRPGYRKALREEYAGEAVRLYRAGVGPTEIARRVSGESGVKVTRFTVLNWVNRAAGGGGRR